MKQFLIRAILFLAILIGLIAALEFTLARENRISHGQYRIGDDVYRVLEAADHPHPDVTTLYLGDSVARQLFQMDSEPSPRLLYLPVSQAVSVAGQYCLLQKVMSRAPQLRHVYFFYTPHSWSNDLDLIFTHDYFCGYFHSPSLVLEIWRLKRDPQLTEAHICRALLPNIMAENSYLNRSQSSSGVPIVPVPSPSAHPLSPTSVYFVGKMKDLCRQRQITLTILPCPCVGTPEQYALVAPIYDARITFYDPALFYPDKIHIKDNLDPIRERFIAKFHLRDQD